MVSAALPPSQGIDIYATRENSRQQYVYILSEPERTSVRDPYNLY